jgi:hypothetical protein
MVDVVRQAFLVAASISALALTGCAWSTRATAPTSEAAGDPAIVPAGPLPSSPPPASSGWAPAQPQAQRMPAFLSDEGSRIRSEGTQAIALGDLDGDGDIDLVVADFSASCVLWSNDGIGHFAESGRIGRETAHGIALGDLDGDGDLDAFVAHNGHSNQVWLNDGSGRFADTGQVLAGPTNAAVAVALGDIDGDGDLDALTSHYRAPLRLWVNDGGGTFEERAAGPGRDANCACLGDLDLDGDLDALVSLSDAADIVWLNDGKGGFTDSGQSLGSERGWGRAALGDVDGDGDPDALIANSPGGNRLWLNQGGAQGGIAATFSDSGQSLGLGRTAALCDLDCDGDLDAVTGEGLWLNDGRGLFVDSGALFIINACTGVWPGDIDGDGDMDLVVGSRQRDNQVWINTTN